MGPPQSDMAITKTQRWLDLIAFLVGHHFPVAVEAIMEAVPAYREKWRSEREADRAAVRRMFERDKDELRAAGIPMETVQFSIEHGAEQAIGYRLSGRDFYLPYLRIVSRSSEEGGSGGQGGQRGAGVEARVGSGPAPPPGPLELEPSQAALAADALHRVAELPASPFAREARSALAKLAFDLDLAAFGTSPVLYVEPPTTGGVRETLRLLTDAVRRRKRVRFRYHGIHRGQPTDRDVAPYGLLFNHGHWYLIGHDAARDAMRVFRLGRIEVPVVGEAGPGPDFDPDPAFDVTDYARREPWELGDEQPLPCDVRFEFPLSLWAERNGHGSPIRGLPGGAVVRRFQVRQTDPFLRWLQSFAGDAIVVDPPELRRAQADMARQSLEAYA
jgi:predicted DNA-binding transcriptional regulator YafY